MGLYLGDGHIWSTSDRSWRLGIYLDASYPGVIESARAAVASVFIGPKR